MPKIWDIRKEAQEQKLCLPDILSTSFPLGSCCKVSWLVPAPGMGPKEPRSLRSHEPCTRCKTHTRSYVAVQTINR